MCVLSGCRITTSKSKSTFFEILALNFYRYKTFVIFKSDSSGLFGATPFDKISKNFHCKFFSEFLAHCALCVLTYIHQRITKINHDRTHNVHNLEKGEMRTHAFDEMGF